jgi:hypothetical protein
VVVLFILLTPHGALLLVFVEDDSIANMATVEVPFYARTSVEGLTAQDFETASIRSAAPSYGRFLPGRALIAKDKMPASRF